MNFDLPRHGGQLKRLSEHYGIPIAEIIDFSANINPDGPPSSVLSALRESLGDPRVIGAYPDLELADLKNAIAHFADVEAENVVIGNGFVPLLESALHLLKVRRCMLPLPAFFEYRRTLERAGVMVIPHGLSEDLDFRYDLDALLAGGHDAVLLANPQNPSGVLANKADMLAFIRKAAVNNLAVLLDEAFIDYAPEHSLTTEIEECPNLILFRSVTKFLGIAGLRVAYALAHRTLARALVDVTPPWPVTTLAAIGVAAGLGDVPFHQETLERNRQRKAALETALHAIGLHTYPSAANFLLIRDVPQAGMLDRQLAAEHRIVVRHCDNYEALSQHHIRVAVRGNEENRLLVHALHAIRTAQRS